MSLPIYQRVAVTDAGDVIPGAEYTVINENTGVAAPIYSDRTGATLLTAPYFADSAGTIQFFIAQGTTYRVAASGGVGTYTDRYVYGVAEAVLVQANGNVGINTTSPSQAKLEVLAESDYSSHTGHGISIVSNANDVYTGMYMGTDDTINAAYIQSAGINFSFTSKKLLLNPNGGNCGIGTSSPSAPLQVVSGENLVAKFSSSDGTSGIRIEDTTTSYDFYVDSGNLRINNTAGSEKMRLDSAGNLLVGKTALNTNAAGLQLENDGYLSACRTGGNVLLVNRKSSDGALATFQKDGATVGTIGALNGDPWMAKASGSGVRFVGAAWLPTNSTGNDSNNVVDLGSGAVSFDDIFATNGTIQPSDRNYKQDILEITAAETAVAKACKGLLRSFRWIDAVEEKGDDARIHFGIIAQDLQDAFTAEGLDADRYGMFISSTWWETQTEVAAVEAVEGVEFVQAVEASEALYSEAGELVSEAVEAVEGVEGVESVEAAEAYTRTDNFYTLAEAPAGATERTRLGVRYSELLAFIIAAL